LFANVPDFNFAITTTRNDVLAIMSGTNCHDTPWIATDRRWMSIFDNPEHLSTLGKESSQLTVSPPRDYRFTI
jgi:hypothetical protein